MASLSSKLLKSTLIALSLCCPAGLTIASPNPSPPPTSSSQLTVEITNKIDEEVKERVEQELKAMESEIDNKIKKEISDSLSQEKNKLDSLLQWIAILVTILTLVPVVVGVVVAIGARGMIYQSVMKDILALKKDLGESKKNLDKEINDLKNDMEIFEKEVDNSRIDIKNHIKFLKNPSITPAHKLVMNALIYYQNKKYEEALKLCQEASETLPDFYEAWYYKGRMEAELQRYPEALSSYEKAKTIRPNNDIENKINQINKIISSQSSP